MIIFLHESLVNLLDQTGGAHAATLASLQICTQQALEGNHVLCGDRKTFAGLLGYSDHLGIKTAAILRRSSDKVTQRKSLITFANRSISIVADSVAPQISRLSIGSHEQIVIPVGVLSTCSSLLAKPLLMVENITDGRFYIKLANDLVQSGLFPDWKWLKDVPLRSDILPGGGHTIAQLFEWQKLQSDRTGLAIADGDYRYPGSNVGGTAAALLAAKSAAPVSPLLDVLVIGLRTIENLIPRAAIRLLASQIDKVQGYRADQVTTLFERSPHWAVFPVKNGVRCFELDRPSLESTFWTSVAGKRRCQALNACARKEDCKTYVLPPISSQLLNRAVSTSDPLKVTDSCAIGVADVWRQLIQTLYSIYCGAEKSPLI